MAHIVGLYRAPEAGAPMESCGAMDLAEGVGVLGDRYSEGKGKWQSVDNRRGLVQPRQVSFVTKYGLEALAAENQWLEGVDDFMIPRLSRRNVVLGNVKDLSGLIGEQFLLGDCTLLGESPCDPCPRPNKLSGGLIPGFKELGSKHGLRASVVRAGRISLAQRVKILA